MGGVLKRRDALQGIDDAAVLEQDHIAVFSHELDHQGFGDDLPAGSQKIDVQYEDPVQAILPDFRNAARFDMLAQNHAEKRRFRRILQRFIHKMGCGILGVDGDVQQKVLAGLADGQQHGLFVWLGDFINAAAGQGSIELCRQRVHGKAV